MGRIIGIDYGQKRCGVAVTDSLRIVASPHSSLPPQDLIKFLKKYNAEEGFDELIIGYPLHSDGSKMYLCEKIDDFLKEFNQLFPDKDISRVEESFSSREAQILMNQAVKSKKKRRDKGNLDMFSAVIILRRYLEHN